MEWERSEGPHAPSIAPSPSSRQGLWSVTLVVVESASSSWSECKAMPPPPGSVNKVTWAGGRGRPRRARYASSPGTVTSSMRARRASLRTRRKIPEGTTLKSRSRAASRNSAAVRSSRDSAMVTCSSLLRAKRSPRYSRSSGRRSAPGRGMIAVRRFSSTTAFRRSEAARGAPRSSAGACRSRAAPW